MNQLRKLRRNVARNMMMKAEIKSMNKTSRTAHTNAFGATVVSVIPSFFSQHWREATYKYHK